MKRGFSLIEVLIVIAIAAILAALLFPTFTAARRSAKISSSVQMLRRLHITTKLYQGDYGGDGFYGDLPEMGLPIVSNETMALLSPTGQLELPSPCGQNPNWMPVPAMFDYIYRPGKGGLQFAEVATLYQENLLIFYDVNCDDPAAGHVWNPATQHFGIGILLSGQVIRKRSIGNMYLDEWWIKPPNN